MAVHESFVGEGFDRKGTVHLRPVSAICEEWQVDTSNDRARLKCFLLPVGCPVKVRQRNSARGFVNESLKWRDQQIEVFPVFGQGCRPHFPIQFRVCLPAIKRYPKLIQVSNVKLDFCPGNSKGKYVEVEYSVPHEVIF